MSKRQVQRKLYSSSSKKRFAPKNMEDEQNSYYVHPSDLELCGSKAKIEQSRASLFRYGRSSSPGTNPFQLKNDSEVPTRRVTSRLTDGAHSEDHGHQNQSSFKLASIANEYDTLMKATKTDNMAASPRPATKDPLPQLRLTFLSTDSRAQAKNQALQHFTSQQRKNTVADAMDIQIAPPQRKETSKKFGSGTTTKGVLDMITSKHNPLQRKRVMVTRSRHMESAQKPELVSSNRSSSSIEEQSMFNEAQISQLQQATASNFEQYGAIQQLKMAVKRQITLNQMSQVRQQQQNRNSFFSNSGYTRNFNLAANIRHFTETQVPPSPSSPMVRVKVTPGGKSPNASPRDFKAPSSKTSRFTMPMIGTGTANEKANPSIKREFSLRKIKVDTSEMQAAQNYALSHFGKDSNSKNENMGTSPPKSFLQKSFALNLQKQQSLSATESRQMEITQVMFTHENPRVSIESKETEEQKEIDTPLSPTHVSNAQKRSDYDYGLRVDRKTSVLGSHRSQSPASSSVKRQVLSHYAVLQRPNAETNPSEMTPTSKSKDRSDARALSLSLKYAELISKQRNRNDPLNSDIIHTQPKPKTNNASPRHHHNLASKKLQQILKKDQTEEMRETPLLSRIAINQMYDQELFPTSTQNATPIVQQQQQQTQDIRRQQLVQKTTTLTQWMEYLEAQNAKDNRVRGILKKQKQQQQQIEKKTKMEKAKQLLREQIQLKHNTKLERLSSKRRKEARSLSNLLLRQSQQLSADRQLKPPASKLSKVPHPPSTTKVNVTKVNKSDIWSSLKNRVYDSEAKVAARPSKQPSSDQEMAVGAAPKTRNFSVMTQFPQLMPNTPPQKKPEATPQEGSCEEPEQEQEDNEWEKRRKRYANFSKIPLLSDPIKSPISDMPFIDPKKIFQGKKKKRHTNSLSKLRGVVRKPNHFRYASHLELQRNQLDESTQEFQMSVNRSTIENITTPRLPKKLNTSKHTQSLNMSLPRGLHHESSVNILDQSNQKIQKSSNFREHKQRLKKLMLKQQALLKGQNCQCLSSNSDSLYEGTTLELKQDPTDRRHYLERTPHHQHENYFFLDNGYPFAVDISIQQSLYSENQSTYVLQHDAMGGTRQKGLEDDTELLMIQTQVLNKRPDPSSKHLKSNIGSSLTNEDDIERHSIAIDMRTMKEMHDTLKSGQFLLPPEAMATLTKNLQNTRDAANSPLKRQTHSTLFNQYNLPEYMIQQSTHKKRLVKNNKRSGMSLSRQQLQNSTLRKDAQKNMDLMHIDKKVVSFKKGEQRLKVKPTSAESQNYSFKDAASASRAHINQQEASPHQRHQMKTQYASPMKTFQMSDGDSPQNNPLERNIKTVEPSLIDTESLTQIAEEKAREAKELALQIAYEEKNNQLQPSHSGFFGPGSAPSMSQNTSNHSLLRMQTHEYVKAEMRQRLQHESSEETPLDLLINQARSITTCGDKNTDSSATKKTLKRPPKLIIPQSSTKIYVRDQSQIDQDSSRNTAVFKSAPMNHLGTNPNLDEAQKLQTTGVAASNLLQKKGIMVGGGGIVTAKQTPSLHQRSSHNGSPVRTVYLPGGFGQSSPYASQTILTANQSLYQKSFMKGHQAHRMKQQNANIDLEGCLQNNSIALKERDYSESRRFSTQQSYKSSYKQAKTGNVTERTTQVGAGLIHTGLHATQSTGAIEQKFDCREELQAEKTREDQTKSLVNLGGRDKSSVSSSIKASSKGSRVRKLNTQKFGVHNVDYSSKEHQSSKKKDSIYVTLTGKETLTDDLVGDCQQSPRHSNSVISRNLKPNKISISHVSPKHTLEQKPPSPTDVVSGRDAACGVSLASSEKNIVEKVKIKTAIQTKKYVPPFTRKPPGNIQVHTKNFVYGGAIELGAGETHSSLGGMDLQIKGTSMNEIIQSNTNLNKLGNHDLVFSGLSLNKSQESMPMPSEEHEEFNDFLQIHALQPPAATPHVQPVQKIFQHQVYTRAANATKPRLEVHNTMSYKEGSQLSLTAEERTPKADLNMRTSGHVTYRSNNGIERYSSDLGEGEHGDTRDSIMSNHGMVSLHDREDQLKNLNVKQEVTEMQRGGFHHINTTSDMQMYNSSIMKIVVTQKKAPSPQSKNDLSGQDGVGIGPIFGNSVQINGVTVHPHQERKKGIIHVGRGVGIIGQSKQVHGNRSRQATMGKFSSSKTPTTAGHMSPHHTTRDRQSLLSRPSEECSCPAELNVVNVKPKQSQNRYNNSNKH